MLTYHKQIDKRTTMKNQNRSAALGPNLIVTWAVCDWHPFRVVLCQAYRGLTGCFLLLRIFSVGMSVSPHAFFLS